VPKEPSAISDRRARWIPAQGPNDGGVGTVYGSSWEGFVIENLLSVAPEGSITSFYRTAAGAEMD
jgi:hypothetical protein